MRYQFCSALVASVFCVSGCAPHQNTPEAAKMLEERKLKFDRIIEIATIFEESDRLPADYKQLNEEMGMLMDQREQFARSVLKVDPLAVWPEWFPDAPNGSMAVWLREWEADENQRALERSEQGYNEFKQSRDRFREGIKDTE